MKGCDETPNPRNILSKEDPSFVPFPVPPVPTHEKTPEGVPQPPVVPAGEVIVK